ARGRSRIVSDGELLRCFRAFLLLARQFGVDRGGGEPALAELEVNPFAFRQQQLVPLDGRGRLGPAPRALPARPPAEVERLLEPRSIAVLGVSASAVNFGRIILRNVIGSGFPRERIRVIKRGRAEIDGVRCLPQIASLPEPVDLLVIAASSRQLPQIVRETIASGRVRAAIMIPGGVGETERSGEIAAQVRETIAEVRRRGDGGPVFLGPNSLGLVSRPGSYDTLFIPPSRLDKRWAAPARPVALVSQSGAFIVSRMSNLETLDPAFAVSLGNQIDVTASDLVAALAERDDVQTIGVYAEGFPDLDGLEFVRQVRRVSGAGKCVVFYKAGRTEPGRNAVAGHTATVAGDYEVCQAAVEQAGGLVTDTFKEFEQLVELSTALHRKRVAGVRVGVVSNAGFETVGMADAIQGQRYRVQIAPLGGDSVRRLAEVLDRHGLGPLVNARNPLDVTPMAGERVYEDVVGVMMDCDTVDAVVVGIVPLTASLATAPDEIEKPASLARRLPELFGRYDKPLVAVVDSGPLYDPFVRALRVGGVPVFPSADQAIRSLGRYLCHRVESSRG
ncbi:MAG TPA: CoA-binding protein, partial [Candidatus Polarisedimenticolaceae bacterium]|nr:CoA-binding protein [Candidatus Polarisedimenticolaceae bacterium]